MRYSDFKIVETRLKETEAVYVIGDSHAKAMGGSNNLAVDGAALSAISRQADRVPEGATVYMTGGHNDVAAGRNATQIANDVKAIMDKLLDKDAIVSYILFPEGTDNTNQENMAPTRQAINNAITVSQDLDGCTMQGDGIHCQLSAYSNIVGQPSQTNADPNADEIDSGLEAGPPYPPEDMEAVRAMQTKLEELGYSVGSTGIDGKYGPRTARAVRAFKADNNIETDSLSVSREEIATLNTAERVETPTPTGNERGGSAVFDLPPLSDETDVQGKVGAILDFIARYESRGYYDVRNGMSRDSRIPNMTIAEVLQYQRGYQSWPRGESTAIGRYQYTRATLEWISGEMGLDINTVKFDQDTQDRIATYDLRRRCQLDAWLAERIDNTRFVNKIAQVWAGIPNSSNQSQYRGIGSNTAGTSWDNALAQVNAIRTGNLG